MEVWTGLHLVAEIQAELVIELIAHHLRGLQLQETLRHSVTPPRKPLAAAIEVKQLERREARRTRRKA